jgi:hypothetical protein
VNLRGFRAPYAPFLKERRTRGFVRRNEQEIRGISLVFREMWDTTKPDVLSYCFENLLAECSGIPHLAKNERDMGHPEFVGTLETLDLRL